MMRGLSLSLLLALTIPVFADPPQITVPVEVRGEPGQFIQVPATTAGKTVSWKAVDSGLNLFPTALLKDTHTAVVTAPKSGRYRLYAVTAADDEVSAIVETIVIVGAPPPVPPIPPCPPDPPGPGPTPEPGKLGMAKVSRDGAAKVSAATKEAEGPKLAAKQRSLAGIIRAGGLAQAAKILDEWRAGNNVAATPAAWKPWADAVSAGLEGLYKAGKLPTPAAWADCFDEIAVGLGG